MPAPAANADFALLFMRNEDWITMCYRIRGWMKIKEYIEANLKVVHPLQTDLRYIRGHIF